MVAPTSRSRPGRRGKILVLLVLLLPVLLGITGLVIDGGLLMAAHRQTQNSADSGARAAALVLRQQLALGVTSTAVLTPLFEAAADSYVTKNLTASYNNTYTTPVVTYPPATGPYAGDTKYVEVNVTSNCSTYFMRVLGITQREVKARAVAGLRPRSTLFGIVVLDPDGNPGVTVGGTGATLEVTSANGAGMAVFSMHGGEDGSGGTVGPSPPTINSGHAAAGVSGNATLRAPIFIVSGGVDRETNFTAPNVGSLQAGTLAPPYDPLMMAGSSLPVPTTSNGVMDRQLGDVAVTNLNNNGIVPPNYVDALGTIQLYPGLYSSISITGGTVNLNPGIYVVGPGLGGGSAGGGTNILSITGGTVTGNGVMIYNTGSDYTAANGAPDVSDVPSPNPNSTPVAPSPAKSAKFGAIAIGGGGTVTMTPPTTGAFQNVLLYQRRWNTQNMTIGTDGSHLSGYIYAQWANLAVAGSGTFTQAQANTINSAVVVGSLSVQGSACISIPTGAEFGVINRPIVLVE